MRTQRPALAQRYAIHLPLDLGDVTPRFVGTDTSTGQTVVIAFAEREFQELLGRGIGAMHRHLAGLVDVVASPDPAVFPDMGEHPPAGAALVAELVRGRTLADVAGFEPLVTDRAVAWTIRILEGLRVLHQREAPHGALSAYAVVAEPKGRAIAPVVSQLIAPPLKVYACAERLAGEGPSVPDDLWAVGLLLFGMLTGKLPSSTTGASPGPCELVEADIDRLKTLSHGRELEAIVRRVLASERIRRPTSCEEFLEMLDCWERRVAPSAPQPRATGRGVQAGARGQPAPWDRLLAEFSGGGKRLEATLDAAEQMRHAVLPERAPQRTAAPRLRRSGSGSTRSSAQKASTGPNRQRSESPRRRMPSFGLELAAFRQRSKPRFGKWLGIFVLLAGIAVTSALLVGHREEKGKASPLASAQHLDAPIVPVGSGTAERPRLSARQEQSACIRSYFRPDVLVEGADLGFVCTEEDFLVVNRRLHDELMIAPIPSAAASTGAGSAGAPADAIASGAAAMSSVVGLTGRGILEANVAKAASTAAPHLVIRSSAGAKGWQLGWYELVATGIIRQNCCREAAPIRLPESTGWCQQLQAVVRRIAADSVKVGDISPGVRSFDETITCLLAQGRHVVYPYKAVPSSLQKSAFQQFLKHAAEVDARRTARR